VVFFSDFLDFELGDSLVFSVADSLLGDFSVLASGFFVLLFVESALLLVDSGLLFFSLVLVLVLFEDGLVALSAAGLLVDAGDFVSGTEADGAGETVSEGFALVVGVMVAAADAVAAGVMVAPALAVAAGGALAFVDAVTPVVVVPVVVVPEVEVTPTLKLGVTP
jgi:hypothetical protein